MQRGGGDTPFQVSRKEGMASRTARGALPGWIGKWNGPKCALVGAGEHPSSAVAGLPLKGSPGF